MVAAVVRGTDDTLGGTCSPFDDGTASWTQTPTGTQDAAGTCDAGYTQTNNQPPLRTCNADLTWSDTTNACTRTTGPFFRARIRSAYGQPGVGLTDALLVCLFNLVQSKV